MTHDEQVARNKQMIADAKLLSYIEGQSKSQIEALAVKYNETYRNTMRIMTQYTKRTGLRFRFRKQTQSEPSVVSSKIKYPVGFCLICKCASENPLDIVPMYRGKNAPVCFACGGTGHYVDAIMGRAESTKGRVEQSRQLCVDTPVYADYVIRCKEEGFRARTRVAWRSQRQTRMVEKCTS